VKVPLGFGASDWYGMLDWVIRTVCRLAGGSLSHVPVARPSEHVRRSAVFSELHLGNGNQFKIHAPSRESRACDTRYWRTKSQGIRFLELLDSSLTNRDLANTSGLPRPPLSGIVLYQTVLPWSRVVLFEIVGPWLTSFNGHTSAP
jgi:hypothetical protein